MLFSLIYAFKNEFFVKIHSLYLSQKCLKPHLYFLFYGEKINFFDSYTNGFRVYFQRYLLIEKQSVSQKIYTKLLLM